MPGPVEVRVHESAFKLFGAAALMPDLTQLKADRGDRRFEALLLASASIVWWTNAAGEFVEEQPYWRDYTGQAWEEYRGSRWVSCLHPDDRDTIIEDWKAAVSSGGSYFTQGRIWCAKYGSYRAFQTRGVAVRNEQGEIEEWLGALTDIQDTIDIKALLERTQEELAKSRRLRDASQVVESELLLSETRYRLLVEQSVDGIFVASLDGRYLDANQAGCDMLGLSHDELLQATFRDVLIADEHSRIEEEVAKLADGSVHRSEWRFRRKDGTVFFGELAGRKSPDGTLVGVVRDVTERKAHEDRVNSLMRSLQGSEERLQVLVGELQHRSRNLIGVVTALAEMTGRASKTVHDFRAIFGDRLRALARAHGLLSKAPSGHLTFDDLLVSELSAQSDWAEESRRVTLNGPKDIMLRSDLVQNSSDGPARANDQCRQTWCARAKEWATGYLLAR